jgi:hypothetical protein
VLAQEEGMKARLISNGRVARRAAGLRVALALAAAVVLTARGPVACANGNTAPYPLSPVIARIEYDFGSHVRMAPGSDNWPITWAEDDSQYCAWGDGGGFGGTNEDGRVSLGVARIDGPADHYTGHNIWGGKDAAHPAQFGGKSYGIIALGATLYMWVAPGSGFDNYDEARLARSRDGGATWQRADWAFPKSDGLLNPTFCQCGRGYRGARDGFVYCYAVRLRDDSSALQPPGQVDLIRAPASAVDDRARYEFFAGRDRQGTPRWTRDIAKRQPVFEDSSGLGSQLSVSYNSGLRRYLLCAEHGASYRGNLGVFDAPEPWGPWTTVAYHSNFGGLGSTFFWNFSNKWLSADGTGFVLVFTGSGDNDSWNTVRGRFVLKDEQ